MTRNPPEVARLVESLALQFLAHVAFWAAVCAFFWRV